METLALIFILILQGTGIVATISQVGKPRGPLTGGVAAASTILAIMIAACAIYLAAN